MSGSRSDFQSCVPADEAEAQVSHSAQSDDASHTGLPVPHVSIKEQTAQQKTGYFQSGWSYMTSLLTTSTGSGSSCCEPSPRAQGEAATLEDGISNLVIQPGQGDMMERPECRAVARYRSQVEPQIRQLAHERDNLAIKNREIVHERDSLASENRNLMEYLKQLQGELEDQKAEVIHYKKTISSSTRTNDQVADDAIKNEANQIFLSIQNFAAKNFRNVQFDYAALPDDTKEWAKLFMPAAHALPSSLSIKIGISILSKAVIAAFDPENAFGRSDRDALQAAKALAALGPETNRDTKPWIPMTRKLILNHDGGLLEEADDALIYQMVLGAHHDLQYALPIKWTESVQISLAKIFTSCLRFSHLLHRQSAFFEVFMLKAIHHDGRPRLFDPRYQEDINNEDEEELHGRPTEVSLFPLIVKKGDEQGENRDTQVLVAKAKVLLRNASRPVSYTTERQRRQSLASVASVYGGARATTERDRDQSSHDTSLL